ncbi:P-loop containing nucleoside triphosphate hydrolase protein [Daldinia decipiens]|uniref:P-loop containing nucleoside triphosphate hydrolase protein n=1 Tax=Daldinia decipiens TaxID=326647 RepID=UPI0020C37129|nr:P-loop containing nucleoside triphosphate hydrolase protein [Daldinia decipiens]KAI1660851.1 P-loop containing nucleoside triphosphate hydrolase protein [Daldinia decipiens]
MVTKSVQILGDAGAGKSTLIGRLIYECGGLELPQLEKLERNGIREFAQIANFYENEHMPQLFYTPSSQYVVDESKTPDVFLWVVDATVSDSGRASSHNLASLISTGHMRPQDNLVVLINKMDLTDWSLRIFEEIVRTFSTVNSITESKTSIIPISATRGDNIVEAPKEYPWVGSILPSQFAGCELVSAKPLAYILD